MVRQWIILAVVFSILIAIPSYIMVRTYAAETELKLYVDGELLTSKPTAQLINGSSYVPLRAVTTILGAEMKWEASSKTAYMTKDNIEVILTADQTTAYRNGKAISLNTPAVLKNQTLMVPARFVSEAFGAEVHWNKQTKTVSIHTLNQSLPIVGSFNHLKTLLEEAQERSPQLRMVAQETATTADTAVMNKASEALGAATDYSTTNVQVAGVDEADVVKTDGEYIYQVNAHNGSIVITKAVPASNMEVVSTIQSKGFSPQDIYIDDDQLIIIGFTHQTRDYVQPAAGIEKKMILPQPIQSTTKAIIYNINDKANPEILREVELEGNYVSSRKVGSALYFVANQYIDVYTILKGETEVTPPSYRDSTAGDAYETLSYDAIRYFPNSPEHNYMLIGGLDLDNPNQPMEVSAYLGSSQNIYASTQHLYVAVTQYEWASASDSTVLRKAPGFQDSKTVIYKFALNDGLVHFKGDAHVPGRILNQFSMDEYQGNFRIATTKGDMWRSGEQTSKNQLYVLDSSLQTIGSVEDIAPGERIYSVRFMGDRAYMVTFRTVDPLFVIDLKHPKQPEILGALKIPGYSDYLHPYDENHIIGFGKESVEVSRKDHQGNSLDTMAYYQGMKVALFDVSDVTDPKEKFKMTIGDRGTESELLHNHKALLFSKEKNLFAFPVTLMEIPNKEVMLQNPAAYGEFKFQGAMVYSIDLEQGFDLKAKITHMTDEDIKKAGQYWYEPFKSVQRILYIGDTLYTLSPGKIKANDLDTFQEINVLELQNNLK